MINHDITSEELILIERYLQHELTEDELLDFSARMNSEPVLREKIAEVRLMLVAIGESGLEDKLDGFHQKISGVRSTRKGKVISIRSFAAAASVALILSFSIWFFLFKGSNKQDLYAAYYKPDPGLMTVMSATDHYDFEKAMVAYRNGEYRQAADAWSLQLRNDPASDTLTYFLGATYQAMGKNDSAALYLKKIAAQTSSSFYGDANWYLALIYIRAGQQVEALSHLKHSTYPRTEELIRKLEK